MSLSRIVVGVDFSPESQRAVDHAMMLARHAGAAVTMVCVAPLPPPEGDAAPKLRDELRRQRLAEDRARFAALRARLDAPALAISHAFTDGHPADALVDAARELAADLVVVGTHGRTGLRRLVLGTVAEHTVRLAQSSVLVARGDAPPGGYRRIVVGVDFSPMSWNALAAAVALAAPGAHVRAVHAWQAAYVEYDLNGQVFMAMREAAEAEVEANRATVRDIATRDDVTVDLELAAGPAFGALDDESGSAELIVVGSHGRRGVRRFLLGSVAEATVRHARCSVLVHR